MTADAASPDTPTDPRELADTVAIDAARVYSRSIQRDLWAPMMFATSVAKQVVAALADAGLLSLSGDSTQTTDGVDPDVLAVLEYVSRGRRYVGVEPYPDFEARRALGRLHDEGSLRSRASGTPDLTLAPNHLTALRDAAAGLNLKQVAKLRKTTKSAATMRLARARLRLRSITTAQAVYEATMRGLLRGVPRP